MKYKITDRVEVAYGLNDGGTVYISVNYSGIILKALQNKTLEAIDMFDHSIITDEEDLAAVSQRYFLIEYDPEFDISIHEAIAFIINQYFINAVSDKMYESYLMFFDSITVKFKKVEMTFNSQELTKLSYLKQFELHKIGNNDPYFEKKKKENKTTKGEK